MSSHRSLLTFGAGGLLLGAACLLACPQTVVDHRGEVVQTTVEGLLRPTLAEAQDRASDLRQASTDFCAAPSAASLDTVQDAWWSLRGPWKRMLVLRFGPVVDDGFDSAIDFWPARPSSIDGGIDSGVATQAELDVLGVASKGMPAVEYLLWDPVGGDAAVLALYDDAAAEAGDRRCAYLELLTADLELQFSELDGALEPFWADLLDAGNNDRYPTLALAVDDLLNGAIAGLHDLSERSLSSPSGVSTGALPQPDLLESRFSDRSRADALDALAGFRRFYLGGEVDDSGELGFSALVAQKSPAIDTQVREQLDRAIAATEAIPEPLRGALDTDLPAVAEAWTEVRALKILLTADVASLLGVTVSLTDNDGD